MPHSHWFLLSAFFTYSALLEILLFVCYPRFPRGWVTEQGFSFFHWSVRISFTVTSGAVVILDWAFLVFSPTPVPGKLVSWLL